MNTQVQNRMHFSAYGLDEERRDKRICIVGAGVSGINAARQLRKRGYVNVTVLESSPRVGGKCFTWEHEGRRFELGAAAVSLAYRNLLPLMFEHRIAPKPVLSGLQLDLEGGKHSYLPPSMGAKDWLKAGPQSMLFGAQMLRHMPHLARPGFARCPESLHAPFTQWSQGRFMDTMRHAYETTFTSFGYGYVDEMPAVYVLKWASVLAWTGVLLPVGYGGLWERVARRLDVRLNTEVRRVTREPGGVRVETAEGTERYDALIVTCALSDAMRFLDATDEERALTAKIRTNPYYSMVAEITGLPDASCMVVPAHYNRAATGKPIFIYRAYPDSKLFNVYSYGFDCDEQQARAQVHEFVERLGGRVHDIPMVKRWSYFPHVLSSDLDEGFYPRLEALQGQHRTWYCGEVFAFSTVETVMGYATELVDTCFA